MLRQRHALGDHLINRAIVDSRLRPRREIYHILRGYSCSLHKSCKLTTVKLLLTYISRQCRFYEGHGGHTPEFGLVFRLPPLSSTQPYTSCSTNRCKLTAVKLLRSHTLNLCPPYIYVGPEIAPTSLSSAEDRATATSDTYKKCGKVWTCGSRIMRADRQASKKTDGHTNTLIAVFVHLQWEGVEVKTWYRVFICC